jgi:hypothetical protein
MRVRVRQGAVWGLLPWPKHAQSRPISIGRSERRGGKRAAGQRAMGQFYWAAEPHAHDSKYRTGRGAHGVGRGLLKATGRNSFP